MNRNRIIKGALLIADVIVVFVTMFLVLGIRYNDFSWLPGPDSRSFVAHFLFVAPMWLFILYLLDFYRVPPQKNTFHFIYNIGLFCILAILTGITYFYFQPKGEITPKTILALHSILFSIYVLFGRILLSGMMQKRGLRERVFFLGGRTLGTEGPFDEVERAEDADLIVINDGEIDLDTLPFRSRYIYSSDFMREIKGKISLGDIDEGWVLCNISQEKRLLHRSLKRILDLSVGLCGAVVFSILLPIVMLLIKIDSNGSIFYKQERIGKDGEGFYLYKFRTMVNDAEKNGPEWSRDGDSRITRVGNILRKTHIDELPQFINVLAGSLSVVGPRPERPVFVDMLKSKISFYNTRHTVKPGITGLAQIRYPYGSSVEDAMRKLEYDLYYIKNRSVLLDLSIILKTARIIFRDLLT